MPLHLELTDYQSDTRWRWVLSDENRSFLADQEVTLDAADPRYQDFLDIPARLDYHHPLDYDRYEQCLAERAAWMRDLGAWAGKALFGGLQASLRQRLRPPATVLQVTLPAAAQGLLFRPFEIAHLDDKTFAEAGLRLVYTIGQTSGSSLQENERPALRFLGIFSLPDDASPLNVREERYQLKHRLEELAQTRGLNITVRTLQYGATRQTLQDALEDGEGWDIIHFSGHGLQGELVLERDDGSLDCLPAAEFLAMLHRAAPPPQLVTLSACYSGAASLNALHAERARLDQDQPDREAFPPPPDAAPQAATHFPSLAQQVAEGLDCAVLAMRYAVGDEFAVTLLLGLFEKLLDKRRTLPDALQLSLGDALYATAAPETSAITPLLFGRRAAKLKFKPLATPPDFGLQATGLGLAFPEEPSRFVGRLLPLLRASQALAADSGLAGVLFYGMAGAGKTSCALELAYRHERGRFVGYVWFKAPDEDQASDIQKVFNDFLLEMETQLSLHQLNLTAFADQPAEFRRRTAPRLRDVLQRNAILVVLDNAEGLLTASGGWRDPQWGVLIEEVFLAQRGPSRLVLTSRRLPATLASHPRLSRQPIHALSWRESALLARRLPHLRQLSLAAATRPLWFAALDAAQGHPKLLELADTLAADPAALAARLQDSSPLPGGRPGGGADDKVRRFFACDESAYEESDFMPIMARWTSDLTATLPPAVRLLLFFLARLEPEDLNSMVVEDNWEDFLKRVAGKGDRGAGDQEEWAADPARTAAEWGDCPAWANAALGEPDFGLPAALQALTSSALLDARVAQQDETRVTHYSLHPAVAETARVLAPAAALAAADWELGHYWIAVHQHGLRTEMEGGGPLVVLGGKRAAPYLLRAQRWEEASTLIERVIQRDTTPAVLAFALPALRQIAAGTVGSERELIDAGVLAKALLEAGRYAETEQIQRDGIARAVDSGDYRTASAMAGLLIALLRVRGHAEEALPVASEKAKYSRRAGLGPWTQLADEGHRLQLLNALGHYAEVLAAVEQLRPQLSALPEESPAPETASPWNVREGLLDTGREAAMGSGQWQTALALNAEIIRYKQARGAGAAEVARTRFNDYGPLLHLGRTPEARRLLEACRQVFEAERALKGLGGVFSALADLEDMEARALGAPGSPAAARFEQTALRYRYQVGEPEDCGISHNNLANYLRRLGGDAALVLAHRLAGAIIWLQIGTGRLQTSIKNLAYITFPPQPPSFAEVVAAVEQIEGVRFVGLFERLPRRFPDGDAAIAAVWKMAMMEKEKREASQQAREQVLAQMPPAVREAFDLDGESFREALGAALEALPPDHAEALLRQLRQVGLISGRADDAEEPQSGPDMEKVLREFDPLLRGIAAVALGDDEQRAQIEELLPRLEQNGWRLIGPVTRLWHGERDEAMLTEGIDANSATLVRQILAYVSDGDA